MNSGGIFIIVSGGFLFVQEKMTLLTCDMSFCRYIDNVFTLLKVFLKTSSIKHFSRSYVGRSSTSQYIYFIIGEYINKDQEFFLRCSLVHPHFPFSGNGKRDTPPNVIYYSCIAWYTCETPPKKKNLHQRYILEDRRLSTAAYPACWSMRTQELKQCTVRKKIFCIGPTRAAKARQKSLVPA